MANETGESGATGRKGLLDQVERLALIVAGLSLVAVVAVQAWQVFARYVLNDSPSWTEPLALVFIGNTAMLGAAVGTRRETHFNFPLLAEAAPPLVRVACRALARFAMIAVGVGLAVFGTILMVDGATSSMAGVPLPRGLRFVPVALGGALIAVFGIERLVAGLREPAQASAPRETAEAA